MTGASLLHMRAEVVGVNEIASAMANILFQVQRETGYIFTVDEAWEVMTHTVRKARMNGKGDDYIPVLLENELRDFLTRKQINLLGRLNECARSVTTLPV